MIKTTVLFMVIITTVLFGAIMPFFIKKNLSQKQKAKVGEINEKLIEEEGKKSYKKQI